MITKIIIKNISSIGTYVIDFKKGNYKFLEDNVLHNVVNPVAIYGYNGSGKSAFFRAIRSLINYMTIPPQSPLGPFEVNNFLIEEYNKKKNDKSKITGSIDLFFSLNDTEYEYFLATNLLDGICEEKLNKKNICIFNRNANKYTYNNIENKIQPSVMPTLRKLASTEINNEDIQKVFTYLSSLTFVNLSQINSPLGFVSSKIFTDVSQKELYLSHSSEIKEILKSYKQFPIIELFEKKDHNIDIANPFFKFYFKIEDGNFKGELPFNYISSGLNNTWILLSILLTLPQNGALFVDDIGLSLHPTAILSFIKVAQERKIQLIFSTHNTNVLQHLRPDQVYFTKWKKGFSSIDRLSKIHPNIREINNIEKMYLSSTFD